MAEQGSLNNLLQWSIENSSAVRSQQPPDAPPPDPSRGLNSKMLAELLGGPSDADLMKDAMTAIVAPLELVNLENKLIAWDNLEQLVEQIDNANNLESLGLWPPLLAQLDSAEAEMRRMAAWCCGTAVQNNVKAQERLLAHDAMPTLARLAQHDEVVAVRKKAVSALSSAVRNFQPGMDELEKHLPSAKGTDASDMDAVDLIIGQLRENAART